MGKIADRIELTRQHHHARRLRSEAERLYANDPDVVFHDEAPEGHDAPHGVNSPNEMIIDAEPISD